jgi:hypothetical protein
MESLFRFSDAVHQSGLAPTSLKNAQAIMIAIEMGLEVGLPPMAALQNIAVVNGRPTIWGDAQLGIVRSTGELEEFSEWYEINGAKTNRNPTQFTDDVTSVCRVKRFGFDAQECAFSVADAKRANLWGKAGPWTQYPARMLRYRSRSFALRDNFGDALRGLLTKEEVDDLEVIDVTPKTTGPSFKTRQAIKPDKAIETPAEPPKTDPIVEVVPEAVSKQAEAVVEKLEALIAPAKEAPKTPSTRQDHLAAIVAEAGGTFDQFIKVCVAKNWMRSEDAMLCNSFTEMNDAACNKYINAHRTLQAEIKKLVAA